MTETIGKFLARRQLREESRELTQQIVLGFGIGVLLLAIVLWVYRQTVEEGKAIEWRDTTPVVTPKR